MKKQLHPVARPLQFISVVSFIIFMCAIWMEHKNPSIASGITMIVSIFLLGYVEVDDDKKE